MTRSRTVIAALCVVSVLALGACSGDDPEPRFAPPSTSAPTSPSATAVSGPVEPTMPAAAKGTDAAAAEAFVRFYWQMAGYAQRTGDAATLRELSSSTCKACQGGIDAIASVYERGGSLTGGGSVIRVLDSAPISGGPRAAIRVRARITNERQRLDLPGDKDDETYPRTTVTTEFIVERMDTTWLVSYWDTKP